MVNYGYYGGAIGDMLNRWAELGFFSYLLPFLLIFSVVFGILNSTKFFKENKAIDAIIALAVGLMALQFDLVPVFFSQVFPRLGVALAIILILLILVGFFIDTTGKRQWIMYSFLAIGFVSTLVVVVTSSSYSGIGGSWIYNILNNWGGIFPFILIIILIAVIVGAAKTKPDSPPYYPPWVAPNPNP